MIPNEFVIKTRHFQFSANDEEQNVLCCFRPECSTGCDTGLFIAHSRKELMEKLKEISAEISEIVHDVDYADIYGDRCWNILPKGISEESGVPVDG